MMYVTVLFILLILCGVKSTKLSLLILSLSFFIYIALSFPAGNDWLGYFNNYDCLVNSLCSNSTPSFEFGYNFVVKALGWMGFQTIIIFVALFNLYALIQFSKNFENKAFIFFAMFCFFGWVIYSEAVRQSIAISILLLGIPSLYRGDKFKSLIFIFIATLFHTTAIVLLVMLAPLYSDKMSKRMCSLIVSSAIIFASVPLMLLSFVLSLLPIGSLPYEKLYFYLVTPQYMPQFSAGIGIVFDFLLLFIVFKCLRTIKNNGLAKMQTSESVTLIGCVLFISFSLIVGKMMPVMTRIGWYGIPFLIILISTRVTPSNYFLCFKPKPYLLFTCLVYLYLCSQSARPFLYEHSRYGIIHQETIFTRLDELNDNGLRNAAEQKCNVLHGMGLSYLCTL
ncbi:MAG TPA: EpsG family protein [Chitinophagaceae bacterium]